MSILLTFMLNFITNPQVLAGLGIVGAILFVFFKGRSSGEEKIKQEVDQEAENLNTAIHKTENNNQKVENQTNETIQNLDTVTDANVLSKLLSALTPSPKAAGDKTNKK